MNDTTLDSVLKELNEITGISLSLESFHTDDLEHSISQLRSICAAYKEKYDKHYFLRSILHNELSAHSISQKASSFSISLESPRALFLLETKQVIDETVMTVLRYIFSDQRDCFLIPLSDTQTVLLHPYEADCPYKKQVLDITHMIIDTLNTEALISVKIACGPPSDHLTTLHHSYEKALTALKIGKRFHLEKNVFYYDELGIDRLVYHLPDDVCKDFLNEVWKNHVPISLDSELISMMNCFLYNNLNIAETARQLHMHRNTLIYRIEKIQNQTNLDIRQFDDAMTLKLALMIMENRKDDH